jgi:outer membrane biosynthesis protein TonB
VTLAACAVLAGCARQVPAGSAPSTQRAPRCSIARYLDAGPAPVSPELIYQDSLLDDPLLVAANPLPVYPQELKEAGIDGWVLLALLIAPDGSPGDVRVMAHSHPGFVPSALTMIKGTRFKVPRIGGRAVWGFGCQPVDYGLVRSG